MAVPAYRQKYSTAGSDVVLPSINATKLVSDVSIQHGHTFDTMGAGEGGLSGQERERQGGKLSGIEESLKHKCWAQTQTKQTILRQQSAQRHMGINQM